MTTPSSYAGVKTNLDAILADPSTPFDEPESTGRTRELAREYRTLITADLQRRGAWQVIDAVERMEDPAQLADSAGYAPWLSVSQKAQLLEASDVDSRLELLKGYERLRRCFSSSRLD